MSILINKNWEVFRITATLYHRANLEVSNKHRCLTASHNRRKISCPPEHQLMKETKRVNINHTSVDEKLL